MSNGHHDKKIDAFYAQEETVESYDAIRFGNKGHGQISTYAADDPVAGR